MLVFVDESGDTGFKLQRNSSRFFTVTAVRFQDREEATKCERAIERLAERVGRSKEYRFVDTNDAARHDFFACVREFDFGFAFVVMNKALLYSDGFRKKESFAKLTIRYCFNHLLTHGGLHNAIVVADKNGNAHFRAQLQSYLKERILRSDGIPAIKKVRQEASHANRLIQLADMVCGAVAKSFTGDKQVEAGRFLKMVEKRKVAIQFWPNK